MIPKFDFESLEAQVLPLLRQLWKRILREDHQLLLELCSSGLFFLSSNDLHVSIDIVEV